MNLVSFNTCCRDCCKIDRIQDFVSFHSLPDNYKDMTEFEFSVIVENWMANTGVSCKFCGSRNIYGENIKIDNQTIYDFNAIAENLEWFPEAGLFLFNLTKENGKLKREIGGKTKNDQDFILECWSFIIGQLNSLPTKDFAHNDLEGQFFITIGGFKEESRYEFRILRMKLCGFNKQEIIHNINKYL